MYLRGRRGFCWEIVHRSCFCCERGFFFILEKALIEASVSVAALPWPAFNSPFSSPELCSCLQRGTGKSHSCAGNADRGSSRNQAEGRCDPSILLSMESLGSDPFLQLCFCFYNGAGFAEPIVVFALPVSGVSCCF